MTERLRVGTRRSPLARTQTDWVLDQLRRTATEVSFHPVPIDTAGDRDTSIGGSPDFTDAIDDRLLRGEIDLAVHSAKDLPVELDRRLEVLAYPRRADPRDCLVVAPQLKPHHLPRGARVGSSSLRRRAQLLRWRPDLSVEEIRGNVDTRIGRVRAGALDAAVLAVAGISRLGRTREIDRVLSSRQFLPAPAQGALAVVGRAGDGALSSLVRAIDSESTRACVTAERAFAATLGGDCHVPLGALATIRSRSLSVVGEVLTPDGRARIRSQRTGTVETAALLGSALGNRLLKQGARDLWTTTRQ